MIAWWLPYPLPPYYLKGGGSVGVTGRSSGSGAARGGAITGGEPRDGAAMVLGARVFHGQAGRSFRKRARGVRGWLAGLLPLDGHSRRNHGDRGGCLRDRKGLRRLVKDRGVLWGRARRLVEPAVSSHIVRR